MWLQMQAKAVGHMRNYPMAAAAVAAAPTWRRAVPTAFLMWPASVSSICPRMQYLLLPHTPVLVSVRRLGIARLLLGTD